MASFRVRILVSVAAAIFLMDVSAFAADDAASKIPPPTDPAKMEKIAKANPYMPKLEKKTREIGARLDEKQLDHLYRIREAFGTIRAVEVVRRDVGNAVRACAKANPEIRDGISQKFETWNNAVDPVIEDKKKAVDNAVNAQTYIDPKEIKTYLKLIEQAADYANRNIDKEIVTTPEACNKLSDSMDRTRDVVAKLLGQMELLPWPPKGGDVPDPIAKTPN